MPQDKKTRRAVRQLSADVARKIAAGEVIDRPNAIVRELMDNAVDSGADSISVEISGGGIEKIRISDNGSGMTKEDLSACARPHATSKIVDTADLNNITTLGFRGEALASIAAVSRLSISSGNWRMKASILEDHILEQIPLVQNGEGTIVMSEGLFENYPARRRFLKRPSSENMLCRETFVEKALPRPDIAFRLTTDNSLRLDLPKDVTLTERFVSALELNESTENFAELKACGGTEWKFKLVIGEPTVYRSDRRQIFIYINGRRVQEFSLLQAIEYGCQGFFPNGTHPVAALFAEVDPSTVDFNIHPAKKEVRFRDSSALHHGVSSTVKEYFRSYGIKNSQIFEDKDNEEQNNVPGFDFGETSPSLKVSENHTKTNENSETQFFSSLAALALSENSKVQEKNENPAISTGPQKTGGDLRSRFFNYDSTQTAQKTLYENQSYKNDHISENSGSKLYEKTEFPQFTKPDSDGFCYIGTVLNCFLVAQVQDTIYFIDQHAAHERIIFNKLLSGKTETQALLIPYKITTEDESEEKYLEAALPFLKNAGFTGKNAGEGIFEFSEVPARWKGTQNDLQSALLDKLVKPEDIIYSVAAMTACKAAVKDGYVLYRDAAEELARQALKLPDPHCPHGRPVWTTLTKEQLFARVRRTR